MVTSRRARVALIACLALHFLGVVGLLGPRNLIGSRPVVECDLGLHYYRAALLRESGGFPGLVWDPAYMGGYVVGGATDVDNRLGELGVWLFQFLPPQVAWNWTLLLLFTLVPFMVYLAARQAQKEPAVAVLATILACLLFWGMRRIGLEFLSWGMYGWAVGMAALPLFFTGVQRLLDRPRWRTALLLSATALFVGLANGLFALYLLPLALIVLLRWRHTRPASLLYLAGAATLAFLVVLPFLLPVLQTMDSLSQTSGLNTYYQPSPGAAIRWLGNPAMTFGHVLLLACVVGLGARLFTRSLTELAACALAVTVVSLMGFLVPGFAALQPLRNLAPALFLACIPAAAAVWRVWSSLGRSHGLARTSLLGVGIIVALPLLAAWGKSILTLDSYATQPSGAAQDLAEYLRTSTDPGARVLIEDDGTHSLVYGRTRFVAFIAREIGREIIGGPHPATVSRVSQVTFYDGVLLGRPVEALSPPELKECLSTYNIGTAVCYSDSAKRKFEEAGLTFQKSFGEFHVFATGLAGGFTEGSPGAVALAEVNEIRVRGATFSPTILKWQFDPRFRTEPPLPLRPWPTPFSPVGFVSVENGATSEFVVRFVR